MCVILEDGGNAEKIVQLPPFIVTASRINTIELQMVMRIMTMHWDASIGTFRVESTADSVRIVEKDHIEPEPQRQEPGIISVEEVGYTIVDGRVIITFRFNYSNGAHESRSYILTNNRIWNHHQGQWWSGATDFTGSWNPEPNGLPAATLTPPPSNGGGGQNPPEHQN